MKFLLLRKKRQLFKKKKKVEHLENKSALEKKDKYDKGKGKFRSSGK